MTWSSKKPTVPGWYWFQGVAIKGTPQMVQVRRGYSQLVVRFMMTNSIVQHTISEIDGHWSGPIPAPEEGG